MLLSHQTHNLLLTSRREIIATGRGMLAVMNKEKRHVLVKRLKDHMPPYQTCSGLMTSTGVNTNLKLNPGKVGDLNRILTPVVCNASTNQLPISHETIKSWTF